MDVVRRGLGPNEDGGRAVGRGRWAASGVVAIPPLAIPGEAGRPVTSGRTRPLRGARGRRRVGEQRAHPLDGLAAGQREGRVLGHVDRDPQRRRRAALADPDLEQPEPARLDRELDVAQVPEVALETRGGRPELGGDLREPLVEDGDRLRRVGPRDDVLALRLEQDVAVEAPARPSPDRG